jgi:hypothetical protein
VRVEPAIVVALTSNEFRPSKLREDHGKALEWEARLVPHEFVKPTLDVDTFNH